MEHIGVRPGGGEACHQRVLKHIAGAAGVLADDHAGRLPAPLPALHLAVVPAQESADFVGVVGGEVHIGLSPEAVGAKILTHGYSPFPILGTMTPPVL